MDSSTPTSFTPGKRGFLPASDPLTAFPPGDPWAMLDELGHDLPSRLRQGDFRAFARRLPIPFWDERRTGPGELPGLRLYYLRLGFLASAYINQVGQPAARLLPRNIARPFCHACALLGRPPILSYDGYALYNWKRFDTGAPIRLGNIDTLQNFVHLYDEHWFILVHVEIEAIAAQILEAVARIDQALPRRDVAVVDPALAQIASALAAQTRVLRRIPEQMDPRLYYKTFRPYIRFFEQVVYEGVERAPMQFRGETGAQSSIMPLLTALMKIPHRDSLLTRHLLEMRRYMPPAHQAQIRAVEAMPDLRDWTGRDAFNRVLERMAEFREVHYRWAQEYIARRTPDPRGTGGTPYMQWLKQLIDETRRWRR